MSVLVEIYKIEKFKKMYLEYRFYDVGKLGTELCKKDVGKFEAIRYICRKKQVSISSVMAFGNHGNDVDLLASCGYGDEKWECTGKKSR